MKRKAFAFVLFSSFVSLLQGQPILSIDFNERATDPAANTQAGFTSFMIISNISATAKQTNATVRTIDSFTVSLTGNGTDPGYDDRQRSTPVNGGDFTQSLLLRDVIFSPDTTANGGLNVTIDGLTAYQPYHVTIWSFDSGSTVGTRVSDWFANGVLRKDNYTFVGSVLPTSDTNYQFSFKASADVNGRLLIQGRRDPLTTSAGGVFLNALQLAPTNADPPSIIVPANTTVYAGDNAILRAQVDGSPPLAFQWQKQGTDIPGATNITLLISNAQSSDAVVYTITVSNSVTTVTSSDAQLTVLPVVDVTSGLISYWPLNTLSNVTPDVTANGNHLTPTNMDSSNLVPGTCGKALSFNGTDEFVTRVHTNSTGLPIYSYPAYTVTLWVKGNGVGQSDRKVFTESSSSNNSPLLMIGTDNAGATNTVDIFVRNDNGTTPIDHRKTSLAGFDGTWHHIAWVDNNGFGRVYVDGVADTNDFTYTRGTLTLGITTVGGLLRASPGNFFNGQIDEVAVWRRALSAADVQFVKNNGPNLAPSITCPPDVVVSTDSAQCSATNVNLGTADISANCGVSGFTNDAPTSFPLGSTLVTWTVRDLNGNTATCVQRVTVVDQEPPRIICPADVATKNDPGQCTASEVALGTPVTTDNCGVATVTSNAPAVFPLGTTAVTWVVTDVNGNTNSCIQRVTILDGDPPGILCPSDISASCTGTNGAQVSFVVVVTDNCDTNPVINCTPPSGSYFPLGSTLVTCTATDAGANTNGCSFKVSVTDPVTAVLTIAISGSDVIISWPLSCTPYVLESTSELTPPIQWTPVGVSPTVNGNNYEVTVPLGAGPAFYQLRYSSP